MEKDKVSANTRLNDSEQLTKEFTKDLSKETVDWLGKYDIGVGEALQREVYSLPSRQQSIFLLERFLLGHSRSISEAGVYFQARNHHPNSKQRYYTKGSVEDILPIYFYGEGYTKSLVLVEDCLSAIKIARQCDAMPLLGSGISNLKLSRLKPFYGFLDVWLDADMLAKARTIKQRAEMIGFKSRVIYSPKDPKEYSNEEITEYLNDNETNSDA